MAPMLGSTPAEELAIRILVGAGLRESELCGFRAKGPDGNPNLIPDPTEPGRFLLRVLWDAGAKGRKSRYVPVTQPTWTEERLMQPLRQRSTP